MSGIEVKHGGPLRGWRLAERRVRVLATVVRLSPSNSVRVLTHLMLTSGGVARYVLGMLSAGRRDIPMGLLDFAWLRYVRSMGAGALVCVPYPCLCLASVETRAGSMLRLVPNHEIPSL